MRENIGNYTLGEVAKIFEHHVPNYRKLASSDGLTIEHLIHRKPEGGFYWAHYVCVHGVLFVRGDMYEAIYAWNEGVDMEWISNCDLGYFQSKVRAIPTACGVNRYFEAWYENRAKDVLADRMKEYESPLSIEEALGMIGGELYSAHTWQEWLNMNDYEDGDTRLLFPDYADWDSETKGVLHSIGWDTSIVCAQHLYGLKDAMQKLKVTGEKETA